jgi:1-acyl-sn-glycerol-3-phosphate acyltransferase
MAGRNGVLGFARSIVGQARGRPGRISNIIWHFVSWIVTNISVSLAFPFFYLLNRTKVFGKSNIGEEPNTLLLSNHQSMIDSLPVGIAAFYPKSLIKPYLIPWNPAASENFFKHPVLAWLSFHVRCIPVRPGRRDLKALHRMIEVMPKGTMTLFPEGTRSRSGEVRKGRPGAGLLILATHPRVIPVAIDGMQDVLPIGTKIPKIGKRIWISFGKPLDYSEFIGLPRTRETAQAIVDKTMRAVQEQHSELHRLRNEYWDNQNKRSEPS